MMPRKRGSGTTHSVVILDMFHYQDQEHESVVSGFPSRKVAIEYARRRVRDSLEHLRQPNQTREELRESWFTFGEDAIVVGGDYAGSGELDFFIDHPATPEERDWKSLEGEVGG